MSKRSVWKNKDGKTIRRNKIEGQFTWWTIQMLESAAYRALSLSARRVIDRIRIEHARHGGKENGKLPVTFQDFEDYGIHRHAIAPAIREAEALGFIRITQQGRAGNAEWRIPNVFGLTHLPTDKEPKPTEDWTRMENREQAELVAAAARKAPSRFGKIRKKTAPKKQNSSAGNRTSPRCGNRTSNTEIVGAETAPLSMAETALLSISRGGGGGSDGKTGDSATANDDWHANGKTEPGTDDVDHPHRKTRAVWLAQSLSKGAQPWRALGISRRSWYRQQSKKRTLEKVSVQS